MVLKPECCGKHIGNELERYLKYGAGDGDRQDQLD